MALQLFFGYISYPLYLIHQNLITGLSIKLHQAGIMLPSYIYPIPFLILVVFLSYCIVKIEPMIKTKIKFIIPKLIFGMNIFKVYK